MIRALAFALAISAAGCAGLLAYCLTTGQVHASWGMTLREARALAYMLAYWFGGMALLFAYVAAFTSGKRD